MHAPNLSRTSYLYDMRLLSKQIFILILISTVPIDARAQDILYSPDSSVVVTVTHGEKLHISAEYKGRAVLKPSEIGIQIRKSLQTGASVKARSKYTMKIFFHPSQ